MDWDGISKLASALTPVMIAIIGYVQWRQGRVVQKLEHNTNALHEQIVGLEKDKSNAEGQATGRDDQARAERQGGSVLGTPPRPPASTMSPHANETVTEPATEPRIPPAAGR